MKNVWRTTAGRTIPKIVSLKTQPDHHPTSPTQARTTSRQRTRRTQMQSMPNLDPHDLVHHKILQSFRFMPNDIVNQINLLHHQTEFQFHHEYDQKSLEFELVDTLQKVAIQIIDPLFEFQKLPDQIGAQAVIDPYTRFSMKLLPKLVQILSQAVQAAIKYLLPKNPRVALCIEHSWKYLVFMIDLSMQWGYDRNSNYIQEQVAQLQKKIENLKGEVKRLENRLLKVVQEQEQEMTAEKNRYYELNTNYEKVLARAMEYERMINEDVRTVADGGTYGLKKGLKELEHTLKSLDHQFAQNEGDFVINLKKVAVVANRKKKSLASQLRNFLGVNVAKQMPGDMVLSTVFTEHPFMNQLFTRNLRLEYEESDYNYETESKLELLHSLLILPQSQENLCYQFVRSHKQFSDLYKNIQTLILPYEEASMTGVQLQQLIGVLLNIQGIETLEYYYINQLKALYQHIVGIFTQVQYQAVNPESKQTILIEDEYLIRRMIRVNLRDPKQLVLYPVTKQFLETFLSHIPIYNQVAMHYETKKEMTVLQVIHMYCKELCAISKNQFDSALSDLAVPEDLLDLGEVLVKNVFPNFVNLDRFKLNNYIVQRFCYLKEQDLKLNPEIFMRTQKSSFKQITVNKEVVFDSIKWIRNILLFNPHIFRE